jgi:hypothetical protein
MHHQIRICKVNHDTVQKIFMICLLTRLLYLPTYSIIVSNHRHTSRPSSAQPKVLPLMLHNIPNLLRARTLLIKLIPNPLPHQPPRQLQPNNPLPQTKHLRIIAQNTPLNRKTIVRSHGPDPRDFVCRNRDSQACAADQDGAVGGSFSDHLSCFDGGVGVGGFVRGGQDADVEDFGDAGVFFEVRFDGGAVGEAGVVAA